ncbi:MAG: hypothetical protein IRZ14_09025 [Chloroflexi bacterium]|nr:hypothetical protein [Chloroflexota bacterium]
MDREVAQEIGRLAHALSNEVALALAALELLHEQGAVPTHLADWVTSAIAALHRTTDHLGALRALRDRPGSPAGPPFSLAS